MLPGLGEGCWHRWVLFVTEHQECVCAPCAAVTGSSLRDAGTTSQLGVFSMQAAQSRLIALKWFIRNVFSLIETTKKFTSLVEFNKYQWGQNGFKPKGLDACIYSTQCCTICVHQMLNCCPSGFEKLLCGHYFWRWHCRNGGVGLSEGQALANSHLYLIKPSAYWGNALVQKLSLKYHEEGLSYNWIFAIIQS